MKKVKKLKVLELDKEVIKKLEEAPMNKIKGVVIFVRQGIGGHIVLMGHAQVHIMHANKQE